MSEEFRSRLDPSKRLAELRGGATDTAPEVAPEDEESAPPDSPEVFSMVSADRRQKAMLELRFLNGNAKALAYSYLVSIDFDPSAAIRLDFSGYDVRLSGRNLAPLFAGLVAQRVAMIRELDALHADATRPADATVVTGIEITPPAAGGPNSD